MFSARLSATFENGSGDAFTGEPESRFRRMGEQRGAAAEHGSGRAAEIRGLAAEQCPDDGAERRSDRHVHRVPDAVDVRDLVRDELDRGESARGDQDVGPLEPVRTPSTPP